MSIERGIIHHIDRQTNKHTDILYGSVVKIHLNFIHLSLERTINELASSVSDSHLKPAKVVMLNSWQEFPKKQSRYIYINMGVSLYVASVYLLLSMLWYFLGLIMC